MYIRVLTVASVFALPLVLGGCGPAPEDSTTAPARPESVVRIEVTGTGFTPSSIDLKPDALTVLEFVRKAEDTCATAVKFPESGIEHTLPLNEPVRVTVRPETGRRIAFACPMDMYKGSFGVAVPPDGKGDVGAIEDGVLDVTVDQQGFHPSRIHVPAGSPTVLRFTRVAENTCNTAVVIPELGIESDLPLHEPVDITVAPNSLEEIAFSCPMEMSTGIIEVREGSIR